MARVKLGIQWLASLICRTAVRVSKTLWRGIRAVLVSGVAEFVLPTVATAFFNRVAVPIADPVSLPAASWSQRERQALLVRSEERRRAIESKGPGLATVTAVLAAAILVAIAGGWTRSMPGARAVLAAAAFYSVMSLFVPLYLVGPIKRNTIVASDLTAAGGTNDPEEALAATAAQEAAASDQQNQKLTNLLGRARQEAAYALALLLLWVLLVPLTGWARSEHARRRAATGQPAVTVVLPHVSKLNSRGTATVIVRGSAGGLVVDQAIRIDLQIMSQGRWQTIGSGTMAESAVRVPFTIPASLRHRRAIVRAVLTETGSTPVASSDLTATMP